MTNPPKVLCLLLTIVALLALSIQSAVASSTHNQIQSGQVIQPQKVTTVPPIFVSIITHNEEPPGYPDYVNDQNAFWLHRGGLVNFANMLFQEGVAYNYQSDWNFLLAATMYDTGTVSTNGKNILRYIKEDLGFEVDPHAHETQYNYADVAYLVEALGVPVSHTVGGFLAIPPEESKLEYFRQPLTGWHYPSYNWQAEILWGGAKYLHQNEETLWISGIWKPQDNSHFLVHDDNAPLPHIGGYWSNWGGLNILLQKQQNGELQEGAIYTQTIFAGQADMIDPQYILQFRDAIQSLAPYTQAGLIRWVGLAEVCDIWVNQYNSEPNVLPYLESQDSLYYQPVIAHDVDLLPDGSILVTDGGRPGGEGSGIYQIDRGGLIQWSYNGTLRWAHNADRLPNGNTIISDSGNNRVIIIDSSGNIIWNTDDIAFSDESTLHYPNDAEVVFPSGNVLITDRDNHRVIEVTLAGVIARQFGVTGAPGGDGSHLRGPHNADYLPNGNIIISDSGNNRILEINAANQIVWAHFGGLNWPRDADRLQNGNTLIVDSGNNRVIEMTSAHNIVWQFNQGLQVPYDADRLSDGNTLISSSSQILEVNPAGQVVWSYGGAGFEEVWIHNPASAVDLYCHIHRPANYDSSLTYPGVVLIPGGNGAGTSFDQNGIAQAFADAGFIVMHFDPDGRGLSTNGGQYTIEDYCGYIQQDGLREVLQYLVDLPETDNYNCGMYSSSYGVTMASGVLARYPNNPHAKFFIDMEGPHNRTLTAQINGGHVPHDTSDVQFWAEREADRFMQDAICNYVRIQTVIDHHSGIPDNHHAIALINAATGTEYGGQGQCLWTRVNDANLNDPNHTYTVQNPPVWLPENADSVGYYVFLLHEMADMPLQVASIDMTPANPPISVPSGGTFHFTGILRNNTPAQQATDVWVMVLVPGYGLYGPLQQFNNVPLSPNQTITVSGISQYVPTYASPGSYWYVAYCGDYPLVRIDSAGFQFTVTGLAGGITPSGNEDGWRLAGWFDELNRPDISNGLPTEFALLGNAPNPFNSSTSIRYALPEDAEVRLELYNILGQKVTTLVNGRVEAGSHTVTWDASNYSSGIYFYKLTADNNVFTKRMTLLK